MQLSLLRFEGVLEPVGQGAMVRLPPEVAAALGGLARIPVRSTINGTSFRSSTMLMGEGTHCVGFRRSLRESAGVSVGEALVIEISRDDAPRTVDVPPDLAAALEAAGLRATFDGMSFTHRREHVEAVLGAKRRETRQRRVAATVDAMRKRAERSR